MPASEFERQLIHAQFVVIKVTLAAMLSESEEMSIKVRRQLHLLTAVDDKTSNPVDPITNPSDRHLQDEITGFLKLLEAMKASESH